MEYKQKRRTESWFQNREFTGHLPFKSGPGAYNHNDYQPKQSWNKGHVPFGSGSNMENGTIFTIQTQKGTRNMPGFQVATQNPGPGQYDLPNQHIIGLMGKSPLQAAYKNMHTKQKSHAGERDAKLLNQISKVVAGQEHQSNLEQRKLMSNRRGSSVISPHGDLTQSQVSRDITSGNLQKGFTRRLGDGSPSNSQVGMHRPVRVNSYENLASPTNIVNPEAADIFTTNMQSHRALPRDQSLTAIKSINQSTNDQIQAFLRKDNSVTHLGDIGYFGGGNESQVAHSINKGGHQSKQKLRNYDSSTMASSNVIKPAHSKLNTVADRYIVNKPSSIVDLHAKIRRRDDDEKVHNGSALTNMPQRLATLPSVQGIKTSVEATEKKPKLKPMLGSTVKKNQGPKDIHKIAETATYEQQYLMQRNIQSILDEQAGVPNSNDYKSFLVYTDNKTGPGFYDPHSKYLEKKAPSARFPTVFLKDENGKKISTDELQHLIMGDGNLARKVNQAQDQIKDYLSSKIAANGKEMQLQPQQSALTSRAMNNTIDVVGQYQPSGPSKSVKNSANRVNIFTNKKIDDGRSPVLIRPQGQGLSPQLSSQFASGVKRLDYGGSQGGKAQVPGPGAYMPDEDSKRQALPVFPTEKRQIDAYAFRNEKSPFKNSTNMTSPAPGHYHQGKGGGREVVAKRLREVKADLLDPMGPLGNTYQQQNLHTLYQPDLQSQSHGQSPPPELVNAHLQQIMSGTHDENQLDIDYLLQNNNHPMGSEQSPLPTNQQQSALAQLHSRSLRAIIEETEQKDYKPQRFGLHQLRDNIQDPVRLAVKEVLKAQRELKTNVVSPGPGHYQTLNPAGEKKNFSMKQGAFFSSQPRFPGEEAIDPLQVRHRARGFGGQSLYRRDVGQDGVARVIKESSKANLNVESEPYIPIYDLQMFEGPQINARHIQRELQMAYDENPSQEQGKAKVITGMTTKQNQKKQPSPAKEQMQGVTLVPKQDQSNSIQHNLTIQTAAHEEKETELRDIYNFKRELFQQTVAKQKGQLQNTIRQKENLISFNSGTQRFQTQKQIQIVTGQDSESGNLYIIKDDKNNLGPGYYRNHDDISNMKHQFKQIMMKNRLRKRNNSLVSADSKEGFGSSQLKTAGGSIDTKLEQTAYKGVAGQYYDSIRDTSILKPTFNKNLKKAREQNMKNNKVIS